MTDNDTFNEAVNRNVEGMKAVEAALMAAMQAHPDAPPPSGEFLGKVIEEYLTTGIMPQFIFAPADDTERKLSEGGELIATIGHTLYSVSWPDMLTTLLNIDQPALIRLLDGTDPVTVELLDDLRELMHAHFDDLQQAYQALDAAVAALPANDTCPNQPH